MEIQQSPFTSKKMKEDDLFSAKDEHENQQSREMDYNSMIDSMNKVIGMVNIKSPERQLANSTMGVTPDMRMPTQLLVNSANNKLETDGMPDDLRKINSMTYNKVPAPVSEIKAIREAFMQEIKPFNRQDSEDKPVENSRYKKRRKSSTRSPSAAPPIPRVS